MSSQASSHWVNLEGKGAVLVGAWFITALAGCAGTGPSAQRLPGAQRVGNPACSLRAVVNLRQGPFRRNDTDLVEIARRVGVNLNVLQSMGHNAKMVVIRENGPPEACENALEELRTDLRIESIERY